jgi:hypothetical protein
MSLHDEKGAHGRLFHYRFAFLTTIHRGDLKRTMLI